MTVAATKKSVDLDLAEIRASVVQHAKDYLTQVPVAERSPAMLKAIVEIVTELGESVEREQARAAAKAQPLAMPFTIDAEGNEIPRSRASGPAVQGLD